MLDKKNELQGAKEPTLLIYEGGIPEMTYERKNELQRRIEEALTTLEISSGSIELFIKNFTENINHWDLPKLESDYLSFRSQIPDTEEASALLNEIDKAVREAIQETYIEILRYYNFSGLQLINNPKELRESDSRKDLISAHKYFDLGFESYIEGAGKTLPDNDPTIVKAKQVLAERRQILAEIEEEEEEKK